MPSEDAAARDYRLNMASLLALFRTATGESQQSIEERMGLAVGKWGRWERAAFPPKAHELAGILKAFHSWGMTAGLLMAPPDLNGVTALRERLIAAARAGTIAADEAEARAMVRRLENGARLAAVRGRRSA